MLSAGVSSFLSVILVLLSGEIGCQANNGADLNVFSRYSTKNDAYPYRIYGGLTTFPADALEPKVAAIGVLQVGSAHRPT